MKDRQETDKLSPKEIEAFNREFEAVFEATMRRRLEADPDFAEYVRLAELNRAGPR